MPGMAAAIGQQLSASPLAQLYPGVNWETMMRKTGEMNQQDHDWTEGIKAIKDSPKRREAASKAIASLGGKLVHSYLTLGRYDVVAIIEAPDDEAAAKFALMTGAQGNLSTETMRACIGISSPCKPCG